MRVEMHSKRAMGHQVGDNNIGRLLLGDNVHCECSPGVGGIMVSCCGLG